MHPQTDIVIPVHNALPDVQECLATLTAHTTDYRLILVDDCSDRETSDYLYQFCLDHPSALMIRTSKQRWFTRASNLGLRLLRTERSVLLNSDCVLDSGWLDELFAVWDECQQQNPQRKIGLVGSIQSAEEPRRYAEYLHPAYVTGHCWLVSVSALFDISAARGMPGFYLDEVTHGAAHICSDRNASWELNKLGYATIASFKAAVGHKGGRSWNFNLGAVSALRPSDLDMDR
jgi:GT2 family glycosyltransferase